MGLLSSPDNIRSSNAMSCGEDSTDVNTTLILQFTKDCTHQAMQMMKTFDIRRKASTVFLTYFHLIVAQTSLFCIFWADNDTSVWWSYQC